jgi:type II secretory pathway component GspD/PulD (secretin)
VVNAFSGAGSLRNTGNGGGGGGGGGGGNQGSSASLLNPNAGGGAGGGGGGQNGGGGLAYITQQTSAVTPSQLVVQFFNALGVNLSMPGKAVFFNDRLGKLFVKATEQDLDTIERAIEALNEVAPQVHIKARFIEVASSMSAAADPWSVPVAAPRRPMCRFRRQIRLACSRVTRRPA